MSREDEAAEAKLCELRRVRDDPGMANVIASSLRVLTHPAGTNPEEIEASLWNAAQCGYLLGKCDGIREMADRWRTSEAEQ